MRKVFRWLFTPINSEIIVHFPPFKTVNAAKN